MNTVECRLQQVGQPWTGIPHIRQAIKRVRPLYELCMLVYLNIHFIRCWWVADLHIKQNQGYSIPSQRLGQDPIPSVGILCSALKPILLQLSPDCRDLLDSIFVVDEKKRISIQEMKKHAWYNKPLPSRLQYSEKRLREEQDLLQAHIVARQLDEVILIWTLNSRSQPPDISF